MADSVSLDRLALVGRLNWDYDVEPDELLSVIDGTLTKATKKKFKQGFPL